MKPAARSRSKSAAQAAARSAARAAERRTTQAGKRAPAAASPTAARARAQSAVQPAGRVRAKAAPQPAPRQRASASSRAAPRERVGSSTKSASAQPSAAQDTRALLLEVGAEAIAAKSFNSCGLTEILGRAGVPKGSFYHYFASKEDFGVALIEKDSADFLSELQPIADDHGRSPLARLRAVFEHCSASCALHGAARQCLIPKLALEAAQLSAPVHAAVCGAYDQWSALLTRLVREAQAAGEVDTAHAPEQLAEVLAMLWEGAMLRMQTYRHPGPIEAFFDFAFDSLLRRRAR
jgi:TetR/AcrR family transcriptional repressor of nem operon